MNATTDPDLVLEPLLPSVRRTTLPVLVLTVANGVFLFGAPHLAQTWYAWEIRPPLSAAFMGTGYLIGLVGILLTLFTIRSWQSVLISLKAFFGLSLLHVAATLMHADRFRWDYPLTWVRIAVYSSIPLGILAVYRQQRPSSSRLHFTSSKAPALERIVFLAFGACATFVSVALFLAPLEVARVWAWTLTPLTARIIACWYGFMAWLLVESALHRHAPIRVLLSDAMLVAWGALLLSLPMLHGTAFRSLEAALAWGTIHGALLATTLWAMAQAWQRKRMLQTVW
jgi:hypothetical protein